MKVCTLIKYVWFFTGAVFTRRASYIRKCVIARVSVHGVSPCHQVHLVSVHSLNVTQIPQHQSDMHKICHSLYAPPVTGF